MKPKIKQQTIQQSITVEEKEIQQEEVIIEDVEPKHQISEQQLLNLAKARERAKERKKELAQLNSKSKGLKEEKLRKDAEESDRLLEEKERYRNVHKSDAMEKNDQNYRLEGRRIIF